MRAALRQAAYDCKRAHPTNFEPANRWAGLDRERKAGSYSNDTRYASIDEAANWETPKVEATTLPGRVQFVTEQLAKSKHELRHAMELLQVNFSEFANMLEQHQAEKLQAELPRIIDALTKLNNIDHRVSKIGRNLTPRPARRVPSETVYRSWTIIRRSNGLYSVSKPDHQSRHNLKDLFSAKMMVDAIVG